MGLQNFHRFKVGILSFGLLWDVGVVRLRAERAGVWELVMQVREGTRRPASWQRPTRCLAAPQLTDTGFLALVPELQDLLRCGTPVG